MKIEIDLSDVWTDENELASEIKNAIIHQGASQVERNLDGAIRQLAEKKVNEIIENKVGVLVSEYIDKLISEDTEMFKINSNNVTLKNYIAGIIEEKSRYNSVSEFIEKYADRFAKDLKTRYDLAFASQIVAKMKEQDLLANDKLQELLPK